MDPVVGSVAAARVAASGLARAGVALVAGSIIEQTGVAELGPGCAEVCLLQTLVGSCQFPGGERVVCFVLLA